MYVHGLMFQIILFVNVFHIKILVRVKNKEYLACIACEYKSFWQLSQSDGFAISTVANLFLYNKDQ